MKSETDQIALKLCVNCASFRFNTSICKSEHNTVSRIDGTPTPVFAVIARSNKSMCGENGVWFKEIPPEKPSWWKTLFQKFDK